MTSDQESLGDALLRYPTSITLRELGDVMNVAAKAIFMHDKEHAPMFILNQHKRDDLIEGRSLGVLSAKKWMTDETGKDKLRRIVKHLVFKYDADLVVMISECWVWKGQTEEQIKEFQKTGKRPGTKVEVLLMNLTPIEGDGLMIINEIKRDGDKVSLADPDYVEQKADSTKHSRFAGYWDK